MEISTSPQLSVSEAIAYLRSTQAIRDRCGWLFQQACQGKLEHFRCDLTQLDSVATYVLRVIRNHYPDLNVPFHSRWRHFEVGDTSRLVWLRSQFSEASILDLARSQIDLAVTSVLLDAGAGSAWSYHEPGTNRIWQRSEGLAIASFQLFCQGGFSDDPNYPFQANATGLQQFSESLLSQSFQVTDNNPLIGVDGRVRLMQTLGQVLTHHPQLFGDDNPRPGHLVDYLLTQTQNGQLAAHQVLTAVLDGLSEIWPGRILLDGVNLGDVWRHSALPDTSPNAQLVPFHKLSQWLTYSLLEPLANLGITITDLNQMTGLAEYRNGGLFVDLGVLQPLHDDILTEPQSPDSEVVVEWRALTLCLLDQVAIALRDLLQLDENTLPLVKVLEGGTWAAGRRIASEKRPNGSPPIQILSDGTVF